jgi:hypothetical protein
MQIILSPTKTKSNELRDIYNRALQEAEELYVASAYLTDWDLNIKLNPACKTVVFLVGTDFGLTRKAAMRNVLRWIPKGGSFSFFAVPPQNAGFHPKIMVWRSVAGRHYCLLGSSNLSKAAFSANYEANILTPISTAEYATIREWIDSISQQSDSVSEDWIDHHYTESQWKPKGQKKAATVIAIKPSHLPRGAACTRAVRERRKQQAAFQEISGPFRTAVLQCSKGQITNGKFWDLFWEMWSKEEWRFQGGGLQIKCKAADWQQVCSALVNIFEAGKLPTRDRIVIQEIDCLHLARNPARRAWLSEILCHFYPELYPVMNTPIQKWLSKINLRPRRGATEGQRYIDLARTLRVTTTNSHPAGARTLAELDGAIWQWAHDLGLLDSGASISRATSLKVEREGMSSSKK